MLDVGEILAVSSNVGLDEDLRQARPAPSSPRGRSASTSRSRPSTLDGTTGPAVAIGAKLPSTPLEMAAAFAIARERRRLSRADVRPGHDTGERVVRAETAATVLGLLEGVTGEQGTGKAARVAGVRVAGKTGTAPLGQDPRATTTTRASSAPRRSTILATSSSSAPRRRAMAARAGRSPRPCSVA